MASGIGDTCVPDPPFDPASGWRGFESNKGYRFIYPESWVDVTGQIEIDPSTHMSPELIDEVSPLPDPLIPDAVREPNDVPVIGPQLTAWRVERVTSDTETLFRRELAWNQTQQVRGFAGLLEPRIELCIAGQPALGFVGDWTDAFIAMFIWERDGALHQAWLESGEKADMEIAGAIFAGWSWGRPPSGAGAITGALMTRDLPDTFETAVPTTSFSVDDPRIHVVYDLADGSVGPVSITWRREGRPLFPEPSVFDWTEDTTFAWAWINPAPGGFPTGSYDVGIEFGGDRLEVPFTIHE